MATYDLANGETVTRSAVEELQWDLSRAVGHGNVMATVMTEDLAEVLALMDEVKGYIRACASNDNEANELLKKIEGK